jgi:hypothetical protein
MFFFIVILYTVKINYLLQLVYIQSYLLHIDSLFDDKGYRFLYKFLTRSLVLALMLRIHAIYNMILRSGLWDFIYCNI